jgi:transcription termination factor NusB
MDDQTKSEAANVPQTLTQGQINERVAVLRRFRELLEAQRNKFGEYLHVLEQHSATIEAENPEAILAHTELEQNIVSSIVTLQKVIKPIETMYHEIKAASPEADIEIPALQADLEQLQKQVLERNEQNRALLKSHLNHIRTRLSEIQNPYRNLKSVYASPQEQVATLIQVDV